MTAQERREDIMKRSGLSEEVVKRVMDAVRDSLKVSAAKGERATLPGICTITTEVVPKLLPTGKFGTMLRGKIKIATSFKAELEEIPDHIKAEEHNKESVENHRFAMVDSLS